nr:hypothetical protein [uncultured Oscillibacter sp.]
MKIVMRKTSRKFSVKMRAGTYWYSFLVYASFRKNAMVKATAGENTVEMPLVPGGKESYTNTGNPEPRPG